MVEKNDSAYHYLLSVQDETDFAVEFFQDNTDGSVQDNELWYDFSQVEIYVPSDEDDLLDDEGEEDDEFLEGEEEEPYVPVYEKLVQITVHAQYSSHPYISIENTF